MFIRRLKFLLLSNLFLMGGVFGGSDKPTIYQQMAWELNGGGSLVDDISNSLEVYYVQFSTKGWDGEVRAVEWNGTRLVQNPEKPMYWETRDRRPLPPGPAKLEVSFGGKATGVLSMQTHGVVPAPRTNPGAESEDNGIAGQAQAAFQKLLSDEGREGGSGADNMAEVSRVGNILYVADFRHNSGSIKNRLNLDLETETEQAATRTRSAKNYTSRSGLSRSGSGDSTVTSASSIPSMIKEKEKVRIPVGQLKETLDGWMKIDRSLNIIIVQDFRFNSGSIDNRIVAKSAIKQSQGKLKPASSTSRPAPAPAAPAPQQIIFQAPVFYGPPVYYYTLPPPPPVIWVYPQ